MSLGCALSCCHAARSGERQCIQPHPADIFIQISSVIWLVNFSNVSLRARKYSDALVHTRTRSGQECQCEYAMVYSHHSASYRVEFEHQRFENRSKAARETRGQRCRTFSESIRPGARVESPRSNRSKFPTPFHIRNLSTASDKDEGKMVPNAARKGSMLPSRPGSCVRGGGSLRSCRRRGPVGPRCGSDEDGPGKVDRRGGWACRWRVALPPRRPAPPRTPQETPVRPRPPVSDASSGGVAARCGSASSRHCR